MINRILIKLAIGDLMYDHYQLSLLYLLLYLIYRYFYFIGLNLFLLTKKLKQYTTCAWYEDGRVLLV